MLSRIQATPAFRFVVPFLNMEPPLIRLCMNGDVAGVREAIDGDVDVNVGSKTPLMWALWNHQNAVVEMLIDMDEVDVSCEDYNAHRLEICRDRRDRRSCKIFPSCVKFWGNNANSLGNYRVTYALNE